MKSGAVSEYLHWEVRMKAEIEAKKAELATELLVAVPASLRSMITATTIDVLLIIGRGSEDFRDGNLSKRGIASRDQLKTELGKLRVAWAGAVEVSVMDQEKSLRVNFLAI